MAERIAGTDKGAAAISFEDDYSKDSERIRILITMTIYGLHGNPGTRTR